MKNDNQILLVAILVILIVFIFGGAGFGMMGFNYGFGNMMYGFLPSFGTMWILGPIFMVLITIALILLIIWLVKQIGGKK